MAARGLTRSFDLGCDNLLHRRLTHARSRSLPPSALPPTRSSSTPTHCSLNGRETHFHAQLAQRQRFVGCIAQTRLCLPRNCYLPSTLHPARRALRHPKIPDRPPSTSLVRSLAVCVHNTLPLGSTAISNQGAAQAKYAVVAPKGLRRQPTERVGEARALQKKSTELRVKQYTQLTEASSQRAQRSGSA
ncbi:hypothetical protein OH76DRAFT_1558098 [Lentinus brumalis]|uniref:Uncharacterized protein n=1 Tax=Lentinus brumalis TaxID=2498619 RepID=A0A371D3F1_9APHY|nr:hypothetical protein OH76DRAFT_1562350 [Polyporus brumalis]RDX47064.1 hypothetical protein OH76DRAFT_1558098 [Polyporus brumalis]